MAEEEYYGFDLDLDPAEIMFVNPIEKAHYMKKKEMAEAKRRAEEEAREKERQEIEAAKRAKAERALAAAQSKGELVAERARQRAAEAEAEAEATRQRLLQQEREEKEARERRHKEETRRREVEAKRLHEQQAREQEEEERRKQQAREAKEQRLRQAQEKAQQAEEEAEKRRLAMEIAQGKVKAEKKAIGGSKKKSFVVVSDGKEHVMEDTSWIKKFHQPEVHGKLDLGSTDEEDSSPESTPVMPRRTSNFNLATPAGYDERPETFWIKERAPLIQGLPRLAPGKLSQRPGFLGNVLDDLKSAKPARQYQGVQNLYRNLVNKISAGGMAAVADAATDGESVFVYAEAPEVVGRFFLQYPANMLAHFILGTLAFCGESNLYERTMQLKVIAQTPNAWIGEAIGMRLFMEFMQFIEEHPDEGKKDPRYTQIQWELMNPIPADLPDPSTQAQKLRAEQEDAAKRRIMTLTEAFPGANVLHVPAIMQHFESVWKQVNRTTGDVRQYLSKEGKELDEKLGAAEYQEIMNELNQSKAELKKVTAELNVAQGAHDDAASEIRKAKGEIQRLEMERKALIAEIEG